MVKSSLIPKTEDQLGEQVKTLRNALGEVLPPKLDLTDLISMPLDDIKRDFPVRFRAYLETLRKGGQLTTETHDRLQSVLRLSTAVEEMDSIGSGRQLFAHQIEVFRSLLDFFEQGEKKGWIKLPTGSGKTAIFVSLATLLDVPTLIIVPLKDLVGQTIDAWQSFGGNPDEIGAFYSDEKELGKKVLITTYRSLSTLLDTLPADRRFPLVICDEAHRSLTDGIKKSISRIPGQLTVIGLTATPDFSQSKSVRPEFGTLIHQMHLSDAIRAGICSGVRVVCVKTTTDMSNVKVNAKGDFNGQELEKALDQAARNEAALKILDTQELRKRSAIVSCLSVAHARKLCRDATARGIPSAYVHSGLNQGERGDVYSQFKAGEIRAIFAVGLLTEGWDCPKADALINVRPTASPVIAEQRGGRVLRLSKGKEEALIIEFVDEGQKSSGQSPVTMVDVLTESVVLSSGSKASSISREFQEELQESFTSDPSLSGFDVAFEESEVLAIQDALKQQLDPGISLSKDYFLKVIEEAGLTPSSIEGGSVTKFLKTHLETTDFSGTFRALCKRYFLDIHGVNNNPSVQSLRQMYAELYGKDPFMFRVLKLTGPERETLAPSLLMKSVEEILETQVQEAKCISQDGAQPFKIRELLPDLPKGDSKEQVLARAEMLKNLFKGTLLAKRLSVDIYRLRMNDGRFLRSLRIIEGKSVWNPPDTAISLDLSPTVFASSALWCRDPSVKQVKIPGWAVLASFGVTTRAEYADLVALYSGRFNSHKYTESLKTRWFFSVPQHLHNRPIDTLCSVIGFGDVNRSLFEDVPEEGFREFAEHNQEMYQTFCDDPLGHLGISADMSARDIISQIETKAPHLFSGNPQRKRREQALIYLSVGARDALKTGKVEQEIVKHLATIDKDYFIKRSNDHSLEGLRKALAGVEVGFDLTRVPQGKWSFDRYFHEVCVKNMRPSDALIALEVILDRHTSDWVPLSDRFAAFRGTISVRDLILRAGLDSKELGGDERSVSVRTQVLADAVRSKTNNKAKPQKSDNVDIAEIIRQSTAELRAANAGWKPDIKNLDLIPISRAALPERLRTIGTLYELVVYASSGTLPAKENDGQVGDPKIITRNFILTNKLASCLTPTS